MLTHYQKRQDITPYERRLLPHLRQVISFIEEGSFWEALRLTEYMRENLPDDDEELAQLSCHLEEAAAGDRDNINNIFNYLAGYELILADTSTNMNDLSAQQSKPDQVKEHDDLQVPIISYLHWLLFLPQKFVHERFEVGKRAFVRAGTLIGIGLPWIPLFLCALIIGFRGSLFSGIWEILLFFLFVISISSLTFFMGSLDEGNSSYIIIASATLLLSILTAGIISTAVAIVLWATIILSVGAGPFFLQEDPLEVSKKFASGISVTVASILTGIILMPIDQLVYELIRKAPLAPFGQEVFGFLISTAGFTGIFVLIALAILYSFTAIGLVASMLSSGMLEISVEQKKNTASIIFLILIIGLWLSIISISILHTP